MIKSNENKSNENNSDFTMIEEQNLEEVTAKHIHKYPELSNPKFQRKQYIKQYIDKAYVVFKELFEIIVEGSDRSEIDNYKNK